jgi:hypothetical protein
MYYIIKTTIPIFLGKLKEITFLKNKLQLFFKMAVAIAMKFLLSHIQEKNQDKRSNNGSFLI